MNQFRGREFRAWDLGFKGGLGVNGLGWLIPQYERLGCRFLAQRGWSRVQSRGAVASLNPKP